MCKHAIVYFYYFFFVYRTTESLNTACYEKGCSAMFSHLTKSRTALFPKRSDEASNIKGPSPRVLRPYRHPQVNRQYGRNTPPRRGPGTLCYHRGGRGVGGQPLEMPSAFEGRRSTDGAVALQRGGRNTIEKLDLTPGLIARAARKGAMPRCPSQEGNDIDGPTVRLSLGRGNGRCIATGSIETHPRRSLNWENGAPGPREGPRWRSANCGNNLFAQHVRLRSEIDP